MPKKREPSRASGFWLSWRWLLLIWAIILGVQLVLGNLSSDKEIPYSQFRRALAEDRIEEVTVGKDEIHGVYKEKTDGESTFRTVRVDDDELYQRLEERGVKVTGQRESSPWGLILAFLIPVVLLVALFSLLRRAGGAGGGFGLSTFGRSKAKLHVEEDIGARFDDVAGVEEAKEELSEVIDFLRHPEKFQRLGGKLPKGILLIGPPGTGKTLLARAIAGEAGVPFFSISGSEFVEMFVGVGAARVRDLFNEAKQRAPCIVFIDELDALGKARGVSGLSNEEREQTLNQLLVELDGFDPHVGVILMAATNRPEILDPALLRAGRFDRQVLVDRPDKSGREAILGVHAREVKLASDADLQEIAAMTPGFAGADLANIVNEAALLAVRRRKEAVGQAELREAVERVIAGLEKKNRVLTPVEKERVAHHESGHALVALRLPGQDEVQKISIIPRGVSALGYTLQLPTEDRFLMTRTELENKICVLLAGRAAEDIIFGEISTGAQDDLRKATDVARSMVEAYSMSEKLGKVGLEREPREALLGGPRASTRNEYSEETAREIDCEIRRILEEQYSRARDLLVEVKAALRRAAARLMDVETISGAELRTFLDEEDPRTNCGRGGLSGRLCV